jgi:hypothetical protein
MLNTSRVGGRAIAGLAVAVAAALALSGCAQPTPRVIPTSQPSVTPVFASDADALAAAEKAYTGYLAASDAIGNDGGKDPERIASWVTPGRVATEVKQFNDFAKTGDHLEGASRYSDFTLQQIEQSSSGKVTLSAYVCDDVSHSRLLDATGKDVTPVTRQDIIPIQVQFQNSSAASSELLVGGSTPWSGSDFCS